VTPPLHNDGLGEDDPWAAVDPPMTEDEKRERFPRIDWESAFATDFSEVNWLPGKFMEHGQQTALVGGGKVGKTLLVHDWIWRIVTGRRFLSDERHEPLRVLYFDRENNLRDVVTRMTSFGAVPRELEGLDYRLFPSFSGALDQSAIAVAELLEIVEQSKPELVVFDTISRFIAGKENDSDTWLSFYRLVHAPLKRIGIAGIRLDHMGKDEEKGSRGSSAKAQDVDQVWELTSTTEGPRHEYDREAGLETIITNLKMRRTHSRSGLGQDSFDITRRAVREMGGGGWLPGCTNHELTDPGPLLDHHTTIQRHVDALVAAGAPGGLGRDKLREWAAANKVQLPGKAPVLADIARALKAAKAA
jgi:ribosomal protein S14